MDNEKDESMTFPWSDKLDWAKEIQRRMSDCISHENDDDNYPDYVKKLYDATYADFFGLDFTQPIDRFLKDLNMKYEVKNTEFFIKFNKKNRRDRPYRNLDEISYLNEDKQTFVTEVTHWYYYNLFCCIKNIFAQNRGLLFGSEDLRFSKQLKDEP